MTDPMLYNIVIGLCIFCIGVFVGVLIAIGMKLK